MQIAILTVFISSILVSIIGAVLIIYHHNKFNKQFYKFFNIEDDDEEDCIHNKFNPDDPVDEDSNKYEGI